MKHYPKTYEDVYSADRPKSKTKLNLNKVSVTGMELDEYIDLFDKFLGDFYLNFFDNCVRLSWLRRNFWYYGKKTVMPMQNNSRILNLAFVKLLRRHVGKDIQIITRGKIFSKLETYFDELFPGFDEGNPFENPDYYKFPFKNISTDFLLIVYQMADRVELLKEADKKDMSYAKFMDYLLNHVGCTNDELGRIKFEVKHYDRNFPFYIRDCDKDLQARKGKKRKK